MRHYNIPVFIPERACPFQCIYCDQQKIAGQEDLYTPNDVEKIINTHLSTINKENSFIQLAFFGGTFTGMDMEMQEEYLTNVEPFILKGDIDSIRISTRPDYINQENLDLLKRYHVTNIELGAQSLVDDVLKKSKRGHNLEDVKKASKMIIDNGFQLGLQMMLGLPGDNMENAMLTAKRIVELGAVEARIYPTMIIKDTILHKNYENNDYTPLSLKEAVEQSAVVYNILNDNEVNVIRIGLFASDDLQENNVIAGPGMFHFKERVMTYVWWDILKELAIKKQIKNELVIKVPAKQLNHAIGFKGENKKKLLMFYRKVKFLPDNNLKEKEYYVDNCR